MKAILLVFSLIFTINAHTGLISTKKIHNIYYFNFKKTENYLGSYLLGLMQLNDNNYFQYFGNFSLGTPA